MQNVSQMKVGLHIVGKQNWIFSKYRTYVSNKTGKIYDDSCRFTHKLNVVKTKPVQNVIREDIVFDLITFRTSLSLLLNCKLLKYRTIAKHDIYLDMQVADNIFALSKWY